MVEHFIGLNLRNLLRTKRVIKCIFVRYSRAKFWCSLPRNLLKAGGRACGWDKFKMRKELDDCVAGRGVLSYYNKRLSIIRVGGDDAIVIFGINGSGAFEN
ncbi:MAG: hypothetical protein CL912_19090 [Deltaproteobacteria bacterium]|jgi:hypothetical protein|nr:hypothetical protein [Deltaproteobacteria bacterium]